ncbi:hypothetical protein GCM10017643_16810 [Ancylobacter dichloromethanicus]|uniref:Uncharacterized protein n=1 Tax=Ancylobacter dichloromethanicus TaxID=518825 RepID=A0A9W6J690_9HYPH|nr:hypothetical protein GCM10017643_16810 [Ancylobacter dichloromethanicus]
MSHSAAAERQRRYRARAKRHTAVLQVAVDLGPLADALVSEGLLGEWDAEDRARIAEALAKLVTLWVKRYA